MAVNSSINPYLAQNWIVRKELHFFSLDPARNYVFDLCNFLQPVGFVTFNSKLAAENAKNDLQVSYLYLKPRQANQPTLQSLKQLIDNH